VKSRFFWKGMSEDISRFVQQCLHCLSNRSGISVPRIFGSSTLASFLNEIIDFDYLQIGSSNYDVFYLLVIRDLIFWFL
jgi:hypothetical protein